MNISERTLRLSKVWCTDGTDVEMLRQPWADMQPGKLYVGSEPKTYADSWAIRHHPEASYQRFLHQNADELMLNAGLLGGSREDVMSFAHAIVRIYQLTESHRFWNKDKGAKAIGDMVAFGMAALHPDRKDRIVTGPRVHTVFKTNGNGKEIAWFRHK